MHSKLNLECFLTRYYTDGSFADNLDLNNQLDFIALVCDAKKSLIIYFSKCRRVVRSLLGGETYSFADGLDFGLTIRPELQRVMGRDLQLRMYTDSKYFF